VEGKTTTEQKIFPRLANGRWGFVDRDGKFVIEARFERYRAVGEGMATVQEQNLQGLVDLRTSQLVCPPTFYSINDFSEGLAEVRPKFGDKVGFVDRKGKVVIPPTWSAVYRFQEGVASVTFYGSTVRPQQLWIDKSGKYLWNPP
jgi:hypothetical protein